MFPGTSGHELFTCEYCPGFWTCNLSSLNKHNRTKAHQKKMKSEVVKINDFEDEDNEEINRLTKGEVHFQIFLFKSYFCPLFGSLFQVVENSDWYMKANQKFPKYIKKFTKKP